ncbi:MAG: hypothetical protein K2M07_08855 [Muribaculaceae bacterium]|nr:hypothetical protein [Muribaculaceae bacterium]
MMKTKFLHILAAVMLVMTACSDDFKPFNPNPKVEETDECRISYFDLDPTLVKTLSTENVGFANLKKGFFDLHRYEVELTRSAERVRCGLMMNSDASITDGDYLLTFSDRDGKPLPAMMCITVKNEHVTSMTVAESTFSLRQGSGTETDPYLIGSARDFLTFLDDLRENEMTNGRDVYFRQTADITLMDQSSTKPGRGYYGYSFAGYYDGGGFSLREMYYRGADNEDSDTGVGIFPALLDGAVVSNLEITGGSISHTYANTAFLAGVAKGHVILGEIRVSGNIDSDNGTSIGGLVGLADNATLLISNIRFGATVAGRHNVGGLVGKVSGGSVKIYEARTPDTHFFVEGYDGVGGVVGAVSNGSLTVQSSSLSHVVSKEDADIRSVSTTGGGKTGGLVGSVDGGNAELILQDVTVECPVGGLDYKGDCVGGLAGSVTCGKNVYWNKCRVTSVVSGNKEVGGFAGHFRLAGDAELKINSSSASNCIVPDDSAAGIEGNTSVGGVFGYFEARTDVPDRSIRVGVNVDGKGEQVGGVVGKMSNCTLPLGIFDMTSSTMQVTGDNHVGGMVGLATNATVTGTTKFDYGMSGGKAVIPSEDSFEPLFRGVVKGRSDVGGILGRGENISLTGLTSACTVISLGGDNIGGVAGSITTKGTSNHLEDLVSKSTVTAPAVSNVGGIAGYLRCDNYMLVHDCINFGSVDGGNRTGGVIGCLNKSLVDISPSQFRPAEVKWCLNMGDVQGTLCTGGIVGRVNMDSMTSDWDIAHSANLNITSCGNRGKITSVTCGSNDSGVGGIVGYGEQMILLQYNTNSGYILSTADHKAVGGIAGSIGRDADNSGKLEIQNVMVYDCINAGTIDSQHKSTHVGGVVGFMEEGPYSYMYNCMNSGKVLNKHDSDNGGLVGYVDNRGLVRLLVNLGMVEHGNAVVGTHKTGMSFSHSDLYFLEGTGGSWPDAISVPAADITDPSKFSRLDFTNNWMMTSSGPSPRNCPF